MACKNLRPCIERHTHLEYHNPGDPDLTIAGFHVSRGQVLPGTVSVSRAASVLRARGGTGMGSAGNGLATDAGAVAGGPACTGAAGFLESRAHTGN